MTSIEMQTEALTRAATGQSLTNYPAIFEGFLAKGIQEADILTRENVFTFQAWKALGRSVRRREHGVRVTTWITRGDKTDPATGEKSEGFRFPRHTTVFHVSQTDPIA